MVLGNPPEIADADTEMSFEEGPLNSYVKEGSRVLPCTHRLIVAVPDAGRVTNRGKP